MLGVFLYFVCYFDLYNVRSVWVLGSKFSWGPGQSPGRKSWAKSTDAKAVLLGLHLKSDVLLN